MRVDSDQSFIRDGKLSTAAGVTSGIDLALAIVEEDHGRDIALIVARYIVVFLRRPGGQSQFSAHLTAQIADKGPIQSIADHILSDLRSDLSVDTLAGRANMSTRNFSRVFLRDISVTPADFVESRGSMRHAASCRIRRCRCNGLPTGEATRHFWPLRLRKG